MAKAAKKANTKIKQKDTKKQAVKPKITKAQLTKKSQLKDVKAGRPKVNNAKIKKTSRSAISNTPIINNEHVANLITSFNQLVTIAGQALQTYINKHRNTNNDNHNIASDDNVAVAMPSDQSDSTTDKEIEEQ